MDLRRIETTKGKRSVAAASPATAAHWAARDGGVKVSEDELLAEVRAVGADEWEQAVAESERELPEIPDARLPAGRR